MVQRGLMGAEWVEGMKSDRERGLEVPAVNVNTQKKTREKC